MLAQVNQGVGVPEIVGHVLGAWREATGVAVSAPCSR